MKKEIIVVDEKNGIFRVTLPDERWYTMKSFDTKTSLPIYQYIPSVTWIAGHYPKGIGFYRWLAEKGWDESQALKNAAGDKIDHSVGVSEIKKVGTQVKQGEPLMMIHYNDEAKLEQALDHFKNAYRLAPKRPTPPPLIVERVA